MKYNINMCENFSFYHTHDIIFWLAIHLLVAYAYLEFSPIRTLLFYVCIIFITLNFCKAYLNIETTFSFFLCNTLIHTDFSFLGIEIQYKKKLSNKYLQIKYPYLKKKSSLWTILSPKPYQSFWHRSRILRKRKILSCDIPSNFLFFNICGFFAKVPDLPECITTVPGFHVLSFLFI